MHGRFPPAGQHYPMAQSSYATSSQPYPHPGVPGPVAGQPSQPYPPFYPVYAPPPQQAQAYYAAQGRHLFVQATMSPSYVLNPPQPMYVAFPGVAYSGGYYNKKGKFKHFKYKHKHKGFKFK